VTRARALARLWALAAVLALVPSGAPGAPLRVATLVPCVADAVERIADRAVVVASVRPSAAGAVPAGALDLGSPHQPSFEVLHASRPELVVIDSVMHAGQADRLGRGPWQLLAIDTASIDATLAGLGELGRIAGAQGAMDAVIASTRRALYASRVSAPVRALTLFGAPGTPMVVTERTWLGDLLRELGLSDVAGSFSGAERFPGYVQLSDEILARLEPEVILLVAHGDAAQMEAAFGRRLQQEQVWTRAAASSRSRVLMLEPELFGSNPGLRIVEAAAWITARLRRAGLPDAAAAAGEEP
jgi:iron complex transport system substrate-binding protein